MKKRILASSLCFVWLAAAVAGCPASQENGESGQETEVTEAAESVSSQEETEENPASEAASEETGSEKAADSETESGSPSESQSANENQETPVDYSQETSWAYLETEDDSRQADVFFVCPTVYGGSAEEPNMSLEDEDTKESFLGAINMEKGIYDGDCRFFAPYYRQIGLAVYELPAAEQEEYLETAYEDVEDAFQYYYENYNDGRPIVLAGFSQGAELCLKLLEECFDEEALNEQLIACYAIGWRVTEEDLEQYPHMKFAEGESDTGVIVAFNSEAEGIEDSLMIPAGTKTLAINPLNWKTDSTPADKSMNLGACFTNYSGEIETEIPQLTGAYIDEERGALKVTDVTPEDYPAGLSLFEDGIYHLYDYQFFYRNLQENVHTRVEAYLGR